MSKHTSSVRRESLHALVDRLRDADLGAVERVLAAYVADPAAMAFLLAPADTEAVGPKTAASIRKTESENGKRVALEDVEKRFGG